MIFIESKIDITEIKLDSKKLLNCYINITLYNNYIIHINCFFKTNLLHPSLFTLVNRHKCGLYT